MKFIKYATIFLLTYLIEANFIDFISIKGVIPDVTLVFLIFLSLRESQAAATVTGFLVGLFTDLFTFGVLGLSSLSNSISCFLTSYFKRPKGAISIWQLAIIVFVITIIHDRIFQFIFLLGTNQHFFRSFIYFTIPKALYTTTIALIVNLIFQRMIWQQSDF
ncbi:rod shape-determining protein MreD [candidate division KSB1 bacterium]|nr:rod shape-determining protein MreD [candidate division KSB1 bacterium]